MSGIPAGGGDERRQRLRDQMKAFYGDPNASVKRAASQAGTQGNPNVPPELDLDSEYFNVNRYTTDLLKRESLKGLVETDTDLLRRVRKLDGELQELVYRNYARFISATDTIREMKDNVVEMDAKLQTLSQNVNTIDGISSQISQQLQVHRSHIEETITANRMLKKVQFLTSLPTTMRRLIDKEEFNVGVKYWVAGDGFLTKHKSIGSITQIQQSCCQLAGELYHAIEQRMCSYPLDDPDAMDRIRGYVEDLRLLRATSLFESAHMADQPPFEESVLQTLMQSVTASFQANVATSQRSLKAALVIPDDVSAMELAKREASLGQVNLREPLAQLKNACAMLAVNSERVYALLDAETSAAEATRAAVQVARDIQPVLVDTLQPLSQSLVEFAMAHLNAIAMDGGSALRDPALSAEALQSATTHLARLLRQFVTAMKTLGEIYLPALTPAEAPRGRGRGGASMGSPVTSDNPVPRYAAAVHAAARGVLQQCAQRLREQTLRSPDAATLRACVPLPMASTNVVSSMPSTDELHAQKLAFVTTRFLYASLAQCTANAVCGILVSEDGVPMEVVAEAIAGLERSAQQLQHRAIVLLGQLEVQTIYTAAFSGSSEGAAIPPAGASATPMVPAALLQLLPEWSSVYDVIKVLPVVTAAAAATGYTTNSNAMGGRGGAPAGSPALLQRRRDTSFTTASSGVGVTNHSSGGGAGSGYRVGGGSSRGAYGGGASSSNGAHSDHRGAASGSTNTNNNNNNGGGSAHPRSSGKLAVAYTRQVMSALQLSVNNIFANTETALHTEPAGGPPSQVMACVVRYVLQGIVDCVRDEVAYTEAQFQRLQVSSTFLLYALLAPAKGSAPRQWRKEWSEDDMAGVQRLLDEACTCAYERYEAKVPLSAAVLEKVVEAAVRSGRAALAAGGLPAPDLNTDSANVTMAAVGPMPTAATVSFPDDAPPPIPAALQRTAQLHGSNTTSAAAQTQDDAPPLPRRHDDPLHSQQSGSTASATTTPTSSRPFTPEASPASRAASVAASPAPKPAVSAAPPPPPPLQQQQQQQQQQQAPAPTLQPAPARSLPAPPSAPPRPKFSAPAPPPVNAGSQYYTGRNTERVAPMDDEEELPM